MQLSAAVEHDAFGIRPEPVAVASLLEDAAYYARTLPGDHPLSWPEPLPVLVMADRERIAQVLRNLLTNAAKYSSSGTPIAVRLAVIDGRLRIAVSDGGPGIGPEELPRIFDKYGRGRDATGRKVPGGGLGLYLSRQIARAHGGDLNVTVTPGSGATFWFDLEVWHE